VKIPAANPLAGYFAHRQEIDDAVDRVLAGGSYILGPEVETFEAEFGSYIGRGRAVGVASGTDAVHLALRACGVGRGDGVITVSHTAVATVAAVELAGATPVLVDVDPATYTMDPNLVEATLQRRQALSIKAIVAVHLYGHPADMIALRQLAERHGLWLIEDCAQAHGASTDGVRVGAWGQLAAFSFYPTKNLGAIGDGGALVASEELAARAAELRQYGWRERAVSTTPGLNSRLDELQAAILRVKLRHLDAANARRRLLAAEYSRVLQGTAIVCPISGPGVEHAFHQYVIRTTDRDGLREFLAANSVGSGIHYPLPVHLQPGYAGRVPVGIGGLKRTEALCREILSLPIHPELTDGEVSQVAGLILEWSRS
jgi:dTDP-4-amino-4,6-dideoxygalactose transaminase